MLNIVCCDIPQFLFFPKNLQYDLHLKRWKILLVRHDIVSSVLCSFLSYHVHAFFQVRGPIPGDHYSSTLFLLVYLISIQYNKCTSSLKSNNGKGKFGCWPLHGHIRFPVYAGSKDGLRLVVFVVSEIIVCADMPYKALLFS